MKSKSSQNNPGSQWNQSTISVDLMNQPGGPPPYSPQSTNLEINLARCPSIPPLHSCVTPCPSIPLLHPSVNPCPSIPPLPPSVTPEIITCPDIPTDGPPPTYRDAMDPTVFFHGTKDLAHHQANLSNLSNSPHQANLSNSPNVSTKIGRQLSQHWNGEDRRGALNIDQETGESSSGALAIVCILLIFSVFLFVIPFPEMIVGYKYMDICNDWFSIWLCVTGTLLLVTWIYVFLIFCLGINTLVLIVINIIMLVIWWSIGMYWCWISPTPLPEYNQPPKYKQKNFGGFFLDELYLEQFEYNVCKQQFYFVYALCWAHLSLFAASVLTCSALFVSFFRNKNTDITDV